MKILKKWKWEDKIMSLSKMDRDDNYSKPTKQTNQQTKHSEDKLIKTVKDRTVKRY